MKSIAIYGKGGIGKSTVSANVSAALAAQGLRVMQIGCDPKADSTLNLLGGVAPTPVIELLAGGRTPTLDEVMRIGFGGVYCLEAGGPTPGLGCAGRGILAALNLIGELDAFGKLKPDVVVYDVLGDVVCGGFAAPIREGFAQEVYVVTSGEKMALFAGKNILTAIDGFADRGYARAAGVILNRRGVPDEQARVRAFADGAGLPIVCDIPRDDIFTMMDDRGVTLAEGAPNHPMALRFSALARRILEGGTA